MYKQEIPGCTIDVKKDKGTLFLDLDFENTTEAYTRSPQFTISGVVNFDFKVERRETQFTFFIRYRNKRNNDTSDYIIVYKHWNANVTKVFETPDIWNYVCSDGCVTGRGSISVKVKFKSLPSLCASLYEDTALTDFKLLGDDGFVSLHKAIAAAHSPYFEKMFSGDWKESSNGVVETPGTTQETLQHFKHYIYKGTLPVECCGKSLLLLAKLYMMNDLENRCLFKLRSDVTMDNVFELVEFAVANKQTRLLYQILDMVQQGDLNVDEN